MHGNESRSRIFKCPRSIWAPQEDVIFKSDTADPVHLQCVIMHQVQRCVLTLLLMVCALGFIFPIKSANYMIIPHYVQGHFGNELCHSGPPTPHFPSSKDNSANSKLHRDLIINASLPLDCSRIMFSVWEPVVY